MPKTTIYCVQPFWKDGRKLARGPLKQFKKEEEARAAGEVAAKRNAGVLVFSVAGSPEADVWDEPIVILKRGDVPALEL